MIPALMIVFAILDLAFVGFRAAAGRDGRIDKHRYYVRAMLFGAACGAALSALLGLATWITMQMVGEPYALFAELVMIGERMSMVFGAYTCLVVTALLVYGFSRHEVRTLSTVAILGPFTLLRPWLVALALVVGLIPVQTASALGLTVVSCLSVLAVGASIDWFYARAKEGPTDYAP